MKNVPGERFAILLRASSIWNSRIQSAEGHTGLPCFFHCSEADVLAGAERRIHRPAGLGLGCE